MSIQVRDALPSDRAFVVSSWSRSYKYSDAAGLIHVDDWAAVMHAQLGRLLACDTTRAIVAFEPDEDPAFEDFLYGWICGDTSNATRPLVHYVYVKEAYRRAGLARRLFGALGVDPSRSFAYTCQTQAAIDAAAKVPRARWEPLIARHSIPPKEPRCRTP